MRMVTKKKCFYVEEKAYDLVDMDELQLNIVQCAMTMYQEHLLDYYINIDDTLLKDSKIKERADITKKIISKLDFEKEDSNG